MRHEERAGRFLPPSLGPLLRLEPGLHKNSRFGETSECWPANRTQKLGISANNGIPSLWQAWQLRYAGLTSTKQNRRSPQNRLEGFALRAKRIASGGRALGSETQPKG